MVAFSHTLSFSLSFLLSLVSQMATGIVANLLLPLLISLRWQRWHLSFPVPEPAEMCRGSY